RIYLDQDRYKNIISNIESTQGDLTAELLTDLDYAGYYARTQIFFASLADTVSMVKDFQEANLTAEDVLRLIAELEARNILVNVYYSALDQKVTINISDIIKEYLIPFYPQGALDSRLLNSVEKNIPKRKKDLYLWKLRSVPQQNWNEERIYYVQEFLNGRAIFGQGFIGAFDYFIGLLRYTCRTRVISFFLQEKEKSLMVTIQGMHQVEDDLEDPRRLPEQKNMGVMFSPHADTKKEELNQELNTIRYLKRVSLGQIKTKAFMAVYKLHNKEVVSAEGNTFVIEFSGNFLDLAKEMAEHTSGEVINMHMGQEDIEKTTNNKREVINRLAKELEQDWEDSSWVLFLKNKETKLKLKGVYWQGRVDGVGNIYFDFVNFVNSPYRGLVSAVAEAMGRSLRRYAPGADVRLDMEHLESLVYLAKAALKDENILKDVYIKKYVEDLRVALIRYENIGKEGMTIGFDSQRTLIITALVENILQIHRDYSVSDETLKEIFWGRIFIEKLKLEDIRFVPKIQISHDGDALVNRLHLAGRVVKSVKKGSSSILIPGAVFGPIIFMPSVALDVKVALAVLAMVGVAASSVIALYFAHIIKRASIEVPLEYGEKSLSWAKLLRNGRFMTFTHEMAHYLSAFFLGVPARLIFPVGLRQIKSLDQYSSPKKDYVITFMGPFSDLLLGLGYLSLGVYLGSFWSIIIFGYIGLKYLYSRVKNLDTDIYASDGAMLQVLRKKKAAKKANEQKFSSSLAQSSSSIADHRVLLVCNYNLFRSRILALYLTQSFGEKNLKSIYGPVIFSGRGMGQAKPEVTRWVCEYIREDLKTSGHPWHERLSRHYRQDYSNETERIFPVQIQDQDLEQASLILAATKTIVKDLKAQYREAIQGKALKVLLVSSFLPEKHHFYQEDVPDLGEFPAAGGGQIQWTPYSLVDLAKELDIEKIIQAARVSSSVFTDSKKKVADFIDHFKKSCPDDLGMSAKEFVQSLSGKRIVVYEMFRELLQNLKEDNKFFDITIVQQALKKIVDAFDHGAERPQPRLEATSLTTAKIFPFMPAHSKDVVGYVAENFLGANIEFGYLVFKEDHVDILLALDPNASEISFVVGAARHYELVNTRRDITAIESLRAKQGIIDRVRALEQEYRISGKRSNALPIRIRFYISNCFGYPYKDEQGMAKRDEVSAQEVIALCLEAQRLGVNEAVICDTTSEGTPAQVAALIRQVSKKVDLQQMTLAAHLHARSYEEMIKAFAVIAAGIVVVDTSILHQGGNPLSGNSVGNLTTEDLVFFLEAMGAQTNIDT
ncbi:MAG: hypothetical protein WCX16_05400, partial [Candidatus Omnitrophota bacterium]